MATNILEIYIYSTEYPQTEICIILEVESDPSIKYNEYGAHAIHWLDVWYCITNKSQ